MSSNPDMFAHYMLEANQQLEAFFGNRSFARIIQEILFDHYNQGFPGFEQLAEQLHTRTRAVQRKLKAEGFTFSQLIEQAKQEMAFRLLNSRKHNIFDRAYRLGFSEPGSFKRSSRKWTGHSTRSYFSAQMQPTVT